MKDFWVKKQKGTYLETLDLPLYAIRPLLEVAGERRILIHRGFNSHADAWLEVAPAMWRHMAVISWRWAPPDHVAPGWWETTILDRAPIRRAIPAQLAGEFPGKFPWRWAIITRPPTWER